MPKYIDLDVLKGLIEAKAETANLEYKPVFLYVANWLNFLHTKDAVVVVRCRDCKHAYTLVTCALRLCGGVDDETFYCASGERRE